MGINVITVWPRSHEDFILLWNITDLMIPVRVCKSPERYFGWVNASESRKEEKEIEGEDIHQDNEVEEKKRKKLGK